MGIKAEIDPGLTGELEHTGIVVIGRNEGDRLRRCLASLQGPKRLLVYVDSGSTDNSVGLARSMGADVIVLDPAHAYTGSRARNEGFAVLRSKNPQVEFVQFVDGDSELAPGWLARARVEMEKHPDWAVAFGRLRQVNRNRTVYNRLFGIEFDAPLGEVGECPGIALVRARGFIHAGGYRTDLIAGEEPELCLRLRRLGWKIAKIDEDMALHRGEIDRYWQWYRRTRRSGYAYANAAWLHGLSRDRLGLRESLSIWFWGLALPSAALGMALPTAAGSLLMLLGYPLLVGRIYRRLRKLGYPEKDAALYACFCVIGKWPQVVGQIRFLSGKMTHWRKSLAP